MADQADYSIGFPISAPPRFDCELEQIRNQSSLLSRHFMVWLYNGTFYLTDDGAENSPVHSGSNSFEIRIVSILESTRCAGTF